MMPRWQLASESQQAAQTVEKLNGEITALDTKLKETRDLLERKELASQARERDLTATVSELKSEVKTKDETLASRVSEVNALTAEVNRMRDGIRGMVSVFNQQAQALGEHLAGNSRMAVFAPPATELSKVPACASLRPGRSIGPKLKRGHRHIHTRTIGLKSPARQT